MKVLGIICEYNPFHNGHLKHISVARESTRCDFVVCIMSGDFVQRGECAITDKFLRVRAALMGGADLVIELPADYAVAPARDFAAGAAAILDGLGVVNYISFGSESGDIGLLRKRAELMNSEPEAVEAMIKEKLSLGVPHARAVSIAQSAVLGIDENLFVSSPNDVLASEYIAALQRLESKIEPVAVERWEHHNSDEYSKIMSAGAIRAKIRADGLESVRAALPDFSYDLLKEGFADGRGPIFNERFDIAALATLRANGAAVKLAGYPGVAEGLEQRIIRAAREVCSIEELLALVKTKRYTRSRIARIVTRFMIGLDANNSMPYARVLGFRRSAAELLRLVKQNARIPIIIKSSHCGGAIREAFERTAYASDFYSLAMGGRFARAGRDYTNGIIIVS